MPTRVPNIKEARARPGLLRIMLARRLLRIANKLSGWAIRLME
jgi:hypothetical protein